MSFQFVTVTQGSNQWLKLRQNFITGTDAPIFYGKHLNFKTFYALWENKKYGKDDIYVSDAMKRGSYQEKYALNILKQKTGIVFMPAVVKSSIEPFLSSLDGMDFDNRITAEIKVPYEGQDSDLWKDALRGIVPSAHMMQAQWGLGITGAEKCYYFVFDGEFDGIIVEILPDRELIADMFKRALEFHARFIAGDEIPDDKVEELVREDEEFLKLAEQYKAIKEQIESLEAEAKKVEAGLAELSLDAPIVKGGGVKVMEKERRKADNLKELIKDLLPEIDLENIPEKYAGGGTGEMYRSVSLERSDKGKKKKAA